MGPPENRTAHFAKQGACRRRGAPRARRCLLKGCERRFHPKHVRQRYCSEECRQAAREWAEVEGPAGLPRHGGGKAEAQRAKPALPEARQRAKTA